MDNKLGEFLKEIRNQKNMSLRDFSAILGISHTYLNKLELGYDSRSGKPVSPTIEVLKQISKALNLDLSILLEASGYLERFHDSESSNQKLLNVNLKSFDNNDITNVRKGHKIPVLGKVAAGIPIEAIENYDSDEWEEIPEEMATSADYFALKIEGKSMEPKFSEGDVVIVKKQDDVESGEIGVVIVNGSDATVKKVVKQDNGIMLVASNQSVYPLKFYDINSVENLPVRIIGKVVELRAKF